MKSDSEIESSDQHIVNAVEFMLQHAFESRASDIHIEPKREDSLIRFRIDGVLHHGADDAARWCTARWCRESRRWGGSTSPRSGGRRTGGSRATRDGREIELRVSTLPTAFGEKMVLRIFDPAGADAGPRPSSASIADELAHFHDFISRPHGIILVTGPTGSGKTTTLYSALNVARQRADQHHHHRRPDRDGRARRSTRPRCSRRSGSTFSTALRHILRQDPDVIMVGEIRDGETAQYAIQAALTGHLVFSTLHTNDAASSITRLADLGVERFLISSTLVGAMAQRLVRKICPHCAVERYLMREEIADPAPGGAGGQEGAGARRAPAATSAAAPATSGAPGSSRCCRSTMRSRS